MIAPKYHLTRTAPPLELSTSLPNALSRCAQALPSGATVAMRSVATVAGSARATPVARAGRSGLPAA